MEKIRTGAGSRTPGRWRFAALLGAALVAWPSPLTAQLGTPFRLDSGTAGLHSSVEPDVSLADTTTLHVVWQEGREAERSVYYQRGRAFGSTWKASDVRLSQAGSGGQPPLGAFEPRVASGGTSVVVVWRTFDGTPGNETVVATNSTNDGVAWTTPVTLSSNPMTRVLDLSVSMDADGNALATWVATEVGVERVYFTRLDGSSGLWSTPVVLDTPIGAFPREPHAVGLPTDIVLVGWIDTGVDPLGRITLRRSTNAGLSFDTAFTVGAASAGGSTSTGLRELQMLDDGADTVMLSWLDDNRCVKSSWSTNDGASFTDGTVSSLCGSAVVFMTGLDLAYDDSGSFVAAFDRADLSQVSPGDTQRVFTAEWSSGTWGSETQVADTGFGLSPTLYLPRVRVAGEGTERIVAWMQSTGGFDGAYDVHATWWDGTSWSTPGSVTAMPASAGADVRASAPAVAVLDGDAAVFWDDRRDWTLPGSLPAGSPYVSNTPIGAPDVYWVDVAIN